MGPEPLYTYMYVGWTEGIGVIPRRNAKVGSTGYIGCVKSPNLFILLKITVGYVSYLDVGKLEICQMLRKCQKRIHSVVFTVCSELCFPGPCLMDDFITRSL